MNLIKLYYIFSLITLCSISYSPRACSCTAFADSQNMIIAKNFDWNQGHGILVSNKKGWNKKSLSAIPQKPALKWTSEYNSITFNQLGVEFPYNGVNEAGLSVEILWLNNSDYSKNEKLPVTNELQWIQYQLDTAATVEEAITNAKNLWLFPFVAKIHYFVCDYKSCAVFSYQNRQLVINKDLQIKALANDVYADSLKVWEGGDKTARFSILATQLTAHPQPLEIADAFGLLEKAHLPSNQWRIVYDKANHILNFKIAKDGLLKILPYQKLLQEGTCHDQQTLAFDFSQASVGDISHLMQPLNAHFNDTIVDKFNPKLAPQTLKQEIKMLTRSFTCN